jgi:hypothetical protein
MVSSNLGSLALYLDNRVVQEAVSGIGAVIVFVTMADGRVCPECRPYAGRMWRVDTIDGLIGAGLTLPYPPQETQLAPALACRHASVLRSQ